MEWRAVIPQLSRKYRVVAPDLLGHGQSAKPRGDYSLGAFAVWLRDLLDELGITTATIIGQSLGGGVTVAISQWPDSADAAAFISADDLCPVNLGGNYDFGGSWGDPRPLCPGSIIRPP